MVVDKLPNRLLVSFQLWTSKDAVAEVLTFADFDVQIGNASVIGKLLDQCTLPVCRLSEDEDLDGSMFLTLAASFANRCATRIVPHGNVRSWLFSKKM